MPAPDHFESPTRRQALRAGLALLAWPSGAGAAQRGSSLSLRVTETAGLRRFGYPVFALLTAPDGAKHARLSQGGKPVPAQFRPSTDAVGRPAIALDFNLSLGPLESRDYVVQFGENVAPGPEPKGGLTVDHAGGVFRIANGPGFRWEVADDLNGFLKAVGNDRQSYLSTRPGAGLFLRDTAGKEHPVQGRATIARQGPLAVALRFEGVALDARSVVTLTFPSSKTWVETTWSIDDPKGRVSGAGHDLSLNVDGKPTLVDYGASATVYGQLRGDERMTLSSGPPARRTDRAPRWVVRQGKSGALATFAQSRADDASPAEGWAHVMDSRRATAAACADFGLRTQDRIEVDAAGRLRLAREFSGTETKTLTFWLHFVPMPVQVGAATSPQAMKSPLRVTLGASSP